MANITLSIEDDLLKAGKKYAQEHNTSLNALVRKLIAREVGRNADSWIEELVKAMKTSKGKSRGKKWKREDLYDA